MITWNDSRHQFIHSPTMPRLWRMWVEESYCGRFTSQPFTAAAPARWPSAIDGLASSLSMFLYMAGISFASAAYHSPHNPVSISSILRSILASPSLKPKGDT